MLSQGVTAFCQWCKLIAPVNTVRLLTHHVTDINELRSSLFGNGIKQRQKQAAIIAASGRAEAAKVEAAGNKEANETLRSSLDARVLKYLGIEAFRQLSQSANAKVVVSDDSGVLLNVE